MMDKSNGCTEEVWPYGRKERSPFGGECVYQIGHTIWVVSAEENEAR